MGKISPVSAKYIISATILIEGIVDRPDVIGAIFGQTEGLLGSDLELRELQRSGRIGRIEVNLEVKQGKTTGEIIIPSSLDKTETAIIAAAIETIQKIGPCDSKVKVEKMEDVRISKRSFVLERAKELLKDLTSNVLPDSHDMTNEVSESVKVKGIIEYGSDRLPAGPDILESKEIILVEGRADVIALLRCDIKNAIGVGGTNIPESLNELCKDKTVIAFVDGDRGGDLIIKRLANIVKIDFVAKAPDGKEVEELMSKEILKSLRAKVEYKQLKIDFSKKDEKVEERKTERVVQERRIFTKKVPNIDKIKIMLNELVGTKGADLLDKDFNLLGKVPVSELITAIKGLKTGIYIVLLDGIINRELVYIAERAKIKYLVGKESEVNRARVAIITSKDLE
ncbi:MAG: DNA primase [Nanoarchaeota archaeon]|nr:DNA primase [Nanoarchaeota archaeon]MBU0963302.1 DNA primase [Nanoarchaeota archaeon]